MSYLTGAVCGLAAMFVSLVSHGGGNLIFNSGFELGGSGYECVKYLRLERNAGMRYEGFERGERGGGRCVRVVNNFGEEFRVFGRELLLKAGEEYTFSVLMKSEVPGMEVDLALFSAVHGESWHKGGKRVKVGGDWERYSFTFKVPDGRKHLYYNPMILCPEEGNTKLGGLWIDDLCLVAGKSSTYEPFRGVELSVTPGKRVYVRGRDNVVRLNIEAFNGTGKDIRAKLNLERVLDESGNLREAHHGKKELLSSRKLVLAAGESSRIEVDMDVARMGAFVITPVLDGGIETRTNPGYVTVVGNYERRPLNLDKDFCVSLVHGGGGGFIEAPAYGESWKKSYRTAVGVDDYLGMLGEMGCRLLRDLDYPAPVFRWNQIEKEQGRMDFRFTDMAVDAAGRHGMAILPILGENMTRYMPSWCADKFVPARPYRRRMKALEGKTFMPPLELWRAYVAKVAEHYRGRISHYEIVNEPNLYLAPEDYMDMLKVAYEEIKRADSSAKVVGFCSTGDLGGVLSEYLENCFKLGGLDYADIVSFHPYSAQHLNSVNPADRQIADLRHLIKSYAGDRSRPLWNTELYYLTGRGKDYLSKGEYAPGDAAQRFLTDLGEGVGQSICVPGETVFRRHIGENFGALLVTSMVYPNANFVAYNALARLFEGAKAVDKIKWGGDAVAYVYEREGKRLAALWNYSGVKGLTLELGKNKAGFKVLDVYGNEVEAPGGILELTGSPAYLVWEGDGKDAVKYLRGLKTSADVPVQAGEQVRLLPENGRWYAALGLRNSTGAELSGKAGIQGKGLAGKVMVDFKIAAGALSTVRIPVELSGDGAAGAAEVKLYVEKRLWRFPVTVSDLPRVYKVGRGQGQSESLENSTGKDAAEHRAEFSASHDGGKLSLKISVRDPEPSGVGGGRDPWEQDCVELFIDIAPEDMPVKHAGKYTGNVARMYILPYEEAGNQLRIKTNGVEWLVRDALVCDVKILDGGYEVNLEIDMVKTGIRGGSLLGFDVAVDDARGVEKATRQRLWSSRGDAYKNRCSFGILELK